MQARARATILVHALATEDGVNLAQLTGPHSPTGNQPQIFGSCADLSDLTSPRSRYSRRHHRASLLPAGQHRERPGSSASLGQFCCGRGTAAQAAPGRTDGAGRRVQSHGRAGGGNTAGRPRGLRRSRLQLRAARGRPAGCAGSVHGGGIARRVASGGAGSRAMAARLRCGERGRAEWLATEADADGTAVAEQPRA